MFYNVLQIKNRATYMQSLNINHNSKACFLFTVINCKNYESRYNRSR